MDSRKTRDVLLDAAKRQFIRNGYDVVSMMDIAQESGLSRRTLYSYFGSKADVYKAAIERETSIVIEKLKTIIADDSPVEIRILDFVNGRFAIIKDMVDHNGTLKSFFFKNSWNLEHFRKDYDRQERQMLVDMIVDGVNRKVFDVSNVNLAADMIQNCIRGFEYPYIKGILWKSASREEIRLQFGKIVYAVVGYDDKNRK